MTGPRDTLGRDVGGYVDPPWIAEWRAQADRVHLARAAGQTVTLGQLQELLAPFPAHLPVEFRGCGLDGKVPNRIDSWRGVYADLALDPSGPAVTITVNQLVEMLEDALERTFEGYKGGWFWMNYSTPVWVDEYGMSTPDRGITAVRPLVRRGEVAVILIVVTDHSTTRGAR